MVRIPSKIERQGALIVERSVTGDTAVYLAIDNGSNYSPVHVDGEALRDALGWTVIDKPLPPVSDYVKDSYGDYPAPDGASNVVYEVHRDTDAEDIEAAALWLLGLARAKRTADPAVEEAVQKIASVIDALDKDDLDLRERPSEVFARSLVQAGVRPPEDDN